MTFKPALATQDPRQIDIAFFFASPLRMAGQAADKPLPRIDWKEELDQVMKLARSSQRKLKLSIDVATKERLLRWLKKGVRLLHIACHGIK